MAANLSALQPVPYGQFEAEVITLYSGDAKRPATLRKVKQVLRELRPYCTTTADLDPLAISRWLQAHEGRRAWTRRSLLGTLRATIGWGVFKHYMADPFLFRKLDSWVPADQLDEPPAENFQRTSQEIQKILDRADLESAQSWECRRLRAAIYTWAYTGAGHREVLGLRIADLDLEAHELAIVSHPKRRLKTGARSAVLPIARPLMSVLRDWVPETGSAYLFPHAYRTGPWFHGRPNHRPLDCVKQLGERAGVPGLTILSFRHSFATLSASWGFSELELKDFLRHARVSTQKHYRKKNMHALRRRAEEIRFG